MIRELRLSSGMIVLSQQQLTTLPDCNDDEVKDAADDVIKML